MDYYLLTCVFLCGLMVGLLLLGALCLYLLSGGSGDPGSGGPQGKASAKPAPHEQPYSPEDQAALEKALSTIRETAKPAGDPARDGPASPAAAAGGRDMEAEFATLSQEAVERLKQNKALCAVLTDFAKLHGGFAKEMVRLSQVAESYVRADNQKPLDKWWNSFSIALDHLAQDHDFVSTSLCPGFTTDLSRIEQEHVIKKVQAHGAKTIGRLKEANATCDARSRELQRLRERAVASAAGGLSVGEHSKIVLKIDLAETALKAATDHLTEIRAEVDREIPSILNDYNLIAASATDATATILVHVTEALVSAQAKTTHILNRLKLDVASIASRVIDKNASDPLVLEILERVERGDDPILVDMKTESIAALAASLIPSKACLPRQFGRCIGEETCVWLNAFAGRMYRDVSRSEAFHEWCCTKSSYLLNKGKRPGFVDVFHVSDVVFGAAPPSIRNVSWLPHCPLVSGQKDDPEHNVACAADICFRSGISFTVHTKLWINWPRDRYAFIPVKMKVEVSEVIGRVHFGVQKRASFLSFIEEPYTRFAVKSEVGGDYKLTDVPRVSNFIIQKIKKYIRNKVCYPKAYKTRVLWPKKWWPEGEDEYKESSSSSSAKGAETPAENSKAEASLSAAGGLHAGGDLTSAAADGNQVADVLKTPDAHKRSSAASVLLTSTGASMRDNFSKWIFKPLLHGKQQSSKKKSRRNGGATAGDSDEESSDDDAHTVSLALEPYRSDLLDGKELWDGVIKRAFFNGGPTSAEAKSLLIPSVVLALQTNDARIGFGHSSSNVNLSVQRTKSLQGGVRRGAAPAPKSRSIDSADTIPYSMRRIAMNRRDNLAAGEAKRMLRTRSYSIADFRTDSLSLSAYFYFKCGGNVQNRNLLDRQRLSGVQDAGITIDDSFDRFGKLSKISSTLSMRLAHAGALLQQRRQYKNSSTRVAGGLKPSISKNRYQNDGFILNTSPRKEERGTVDDVEALDVADDSTDTSKAKLTNFFRFGRQLEKAKDALKSGLRRPDNRRSGYGSVPVVGSPASDVDAVSCVGLSTDRQSVSKLPEAGAFSPGQDVESVKISLPRMICSGGTDGSPTSPFLVGIKKSPTKTIDPEKEAESLAWQARAQAISEASSSGEYPSMQGFLLMKQNLPSCKKWVVLRQGNLGVFNSPADNSKYGVPLTHVSLLGAICRPASKDACCLEIGIPMENAPAKDNTTGSRSASPVTPTVSFYWMPFWADSEVQCRAWVMAVQQSSLRLQDEKKKQKEEHDAQIKQRATN